MEKISMEKYCVVIIGAGIAGLSCAKYLIENDIQDFIIIEANDQIGGRCQTIQFCKFSSLMMSLFRGENKLHILSLLSNIDKYLIILKFSALDSEEI